ncbi:MAG: zinc ribbon domain-containing protein [Steroidobacteraceae bacterium]
MPFYEYQCAKCGHHLEAMQKVSDAPLKKCPDCGKSALQRLMSAPVFRLKGSGWYETDFKSEQDNKRNLADKPEADGAKDEKKDDKKDAKADAKPEAKPGEPSKPGEPLKSGEASKTGDGAKPDSAKAAKPAATAVTPGKSRKLTPARKVRSKARAARR